MELNWKKFGLQDFAHYCVQIKLEHPKFTAASSMKVGNQLGIYSTLPYAQEPQDGFMFHTELNRA